MLTGELLIKKKFRTQKKKFTETSARRIQWKMVKKWNVI